MISREHHGGKRRFSRLTTITNITKQINSHLQIKNDNILLSTDLGAAFDTLDHVTLLKKIDHHDIRGKELKLFSSYLGKKD